MSEAAGTEPAHDDDLQVSSITVIPMMTDAGVPVPGTSAACLLMANRNQLRAIETPAGWSLPAVTLATFIEAQWEHLEKPLRLLIELVDSDGIPAYTMPGPDEGGQPAFLNVDFTISRVLDAPEGIPAKFTHIVPFNAGAFWIRGPRRRYVWKCSVGNHRGQYGFYVAPPLDPS